MSLSWYNGFSPELRQASWVWLKAEVAAGRVDKPTRCESCGESRGQIDHHTEDYSRPFGPHIYAYELCFRCHMALHARFRSPGMWAAYLDQLEAGAIWEPLWSRKQIGAIWEQGWASRPTAMGEPRCTLSFFRSLTTDRESTTPRPPQMTLFE